MNRLTAQELRIAAVIALGGLMAVLDTTIVAVALPRFMTTFSASLTTIQWIVTAYALGMVAAMPLAATFAQRWGARRVYLTALLVFTVASAAAGAAGDLGWLIAARAVQGLAGGLINPLGMTIGFGAVAPERRSRMTAITGLPLLIGPILGPMLGGVLLDSLSWRALFFITVPPALLAVVGVLRWVPADTPSAKRAPIDFAGGLLLVPGVVAVAYGFSEETLGMDVRSGIVAAGLVLMAVFIRRSWSHHAPLLNVRLLRDRTFGRNTAVLVLYAAPYFGSMLLMPAYIQVMRGDSALTSALMMVPAAIGMGITIQFAARVLERFGPRIVVGTGLSLAIVSTALTALVLTPDTPYLVLGILGLVQGAGTGAIMMPTIVSAGRELRGSDLASGSAILPLASTIASAVGTAAVSAVFTGLIAAATAGQGLAALSDPGSALTGEVVDAYRLTLVGVLAVMVFALVVRLRTRPAPATEPATVRSAA
ncbi:DHA2 family efflux MFS transporter permease subunit [Amycolatopsis roodepoortensis]|uniref:EmrB/QacA subfamily drug resistance transporter n=1 Tax=Amycolatopsis roodepoortensis TaxID=700274 RepID=A0ABR9L999_9PSEU|nr:DHA2 family efflux MFS transporter permease subunit [Amycolatopsis roodepoortensis]MBE1577110.1 EmrB/QacA subfamily drug resistance transporter [Amycolatopsis roodepoortensis]